MRWTKVAGILAVLLALSGCAYGYRTVVVGRYSTSSRPDASYYCYDCHGYRFFDPYYDWCTQHGLRYRWGDYPRVARLYRERYVRIRETHPEYGRYRYRPDYRATTRYREARDYEAWRRGDGKDHTLERTSRTRGKSGTSAPKEGGENKKKPKRGEGRSPAWPGGR